MNAKARTLCLVAIALLLGVGLLHFRQAYGDELPSRSIQLSRGDTGVSDTYLVKFTFPGGSTLGSLRLDFCSESPLIGQPCTLPAGMSLAGTTLASQTGGANFSVQSVSGTSIVLTRAAGTFGNVPLSFTFANIVNPSNPGSYFGRLQTYASTNGTGANNGYGGIALALASNVQISATVPPYLYFCVGISVANTDCTTVTGDYINFGNFSANTASTAQTQMVAGTNAETGYAITANGSTLTSGSNVIPGLATADTSRPGTSQFGMNLVANQDPQVGRNPDGSGNGVAATGYDQANKYKFVNGEVVAKTVAPDEARRYTTSYIANIARTQTPGVYVSTLTYICTAVF